MQWEAPFQGIIDILIENAGHSLAWGSFLGLFAFGWFLKWR
jgi:hypothetical protein